MVATGYHYLKWDGGWIAQGNCEQEVHGIACDYCIGGWIANVLLPLASTTTKQQVILRQMTQTDSCALIVLFIF